jgi:hypothetical protein
MQRHMTSSSWEFDDALKKPSPLVGEGAERRRREAGEGAHP